MQGSREVVGVYRHVCIHIHMDFPTCINTYMVFVYMYIYTYNMYVYIYIYILLCLYGVLNFSIGQLNACTSVVVLMPQRMYGTLLYSTLLYSTLLYSTLLYSTLLYSTLLYSATVCCIEFCHIILHDILFHFILFYSILFYSFLFYYIPLYYTASAAEDELPGAAHLQEGLGDPVAGGGGPHRPARVGE